MKAFILQLNTILPWHWENLRTYLLKCKDCDQISIFPAYSQGMTETHIFQSLIKAMF